MIPQPKLVRLLNLGPTQWLRTQSVYRSCAGLIGDDSPATIVTSAPLHGYLAVGGGQQPGAALDLAACARLDLPVVSSPLSAPVTYLDSNALVWQWVFYQRDPDELARLLLDGIGQALEALGLDNARRSGDRIVIGDRLLVKSQTGRIGPAGIAQAELFLKLDTRAVGQVTEGQPRTYLWRELPRPVSPDRVEVELLRAFADGLGQSVERGRPRPAETRLSKQIDLELLEQAAHLSGTEVILDVEH